MNQLAQLQAAGQSVWLDNIRRSMFASGELRKLIDLGLRGMTSNPTIFEKAIGAGDDYDAQLRSLIGSEHDPGRLFEALAIDDIRHALDEFRPLYDATDGGDGFVSIEVSPLLANDTKGTIEAAKRLWKTIDRPNLMVKIPGTPAGVPAITEAIASGININVTLLFSIASYEAAANAFVTGLEQRAARGKSIERINSVASVFISRIDSAVDKLLEAKIAKGENVADLLGKAGIANTKLTYRRYRSLFESERFEKLKGRGGRVQRPLWASTGTKNPKYSDLMYVEELVAPNTVNTVPPATLEALLEHGKIRRDTALEGLDEASATLDALAKAQISLFDVTEKLQLDGVKLFSDSFKAMLEAIEYKQKALGERKQERLTSVLGNAQTGADAALATLAQRDFLQRLWKKDPTLWSAEASHAAIIKNALGWLTIAEETIEAVVDLEHFAKQVAQQFRHVVVLGMGGSSLAPDIMRATFGEIDGFPRLHILDSSDPAQIKALEDELDIAATLFIVASKSGTTTEPDAFFRYFYQAAQRVVGMANAGSHFVAITDPETKLAVDAAAHDFRRVFLNAADIGGRYSALSYFGMVPAALAGYDVRSLLDRALGAMHANDRTVAVDRATGTRFGAILGGLAKAGRDKLTIVTHPSVAAFGAWAEQLIAESTGKSGVGIVPVEGEPLGGSQAYGDDRVFVYVGDGLPGDDAAQSSALEQLEAAGQPVVRLAMTDAYDLGEQFYLWEVATAAAGCLLEIDAFDQPNVQESKDNTKRLLAEYLSSAGGAFSEPPAALQTAETRVIPLAGSRELRLGEDLASSLAAIFSQIRPHDYVAFTAYIAMNGEHRRLLTELRTKIRNALRVATTVGFGPRFLHSTGQLHKGGPATGVFLQLTSDAPFDLAIPGMVGFRALERAQALGDFASLDSRGRRGARLHFPDLARGLAALAAAVDDAVAAKA